MAQFHSCSFSIASVVFVPADPFKIVPAGCLMAEETLVHLCVRLVANLLIDHLEVHHVVARRRLMTLRAGLRGRGWMTELRDRPLLGAVA